MTVTIILINIIFFIIIYIVLNNKINQIKKEYIKNSLLDEMRDLITIFSDEVHHNVTIMEDLISQAEEKIKKFENFDIKYNDKIVETDEIDETYNQHNTFEEKENVNQDIEEKPWQEKAETLFENGYKLDEIANLCNKTVGEIKFVIEVIKLKKRK